MVMRKAALIVSGALFVLAQAALFATPQTALGHGAEDPLLAKLTVDQLEWRDSDEGSQQAIEAQAWLGYNLNKLWFKTENERQDGSSEHSEIQALYSRAVAPFWDLQAGLRRDIEDDRHWAVIGIQGLAPFLFEIDTALFIGESGHGALRIEAEYELRLTQRLLLTPEIEANFHAQNDADSETGAGLSDIEAGLRLNYYLRREIAPYIGLHWNKQYGNTADYARSANGSTSDSQLVVGIRLWF